MFNILLDEYPGEWNGYKLNTDYRIGIMMTLASSDKRLNDREKTRAIINLLFDGSCPQSIEECMECVEWFLNGWSHDKHKKSGSSVAVMDFNADQGRIYSAFLSQYKIDLNIEDMHFWKFMMLLSNLEECNFTRVVDIRAKKMTGKMSSEERKHYADAKRTYAITYEEEQTEEDKEAVKEVTETFLKYIGGK